MPALRLFTSESVSEGHPDKVADRISDTVLDSFLAADREARVACETLVTTNRIVLAGEVRGPASVTREMLVEGARAAVRDIGYDQAGFSWKNADVQYYLHEQSADIAVGVDVLHGRKGRVGRHGQRTLLREVGLEQQHVVDDAVVLALLLADAVHEHRERAPDATG